MEHTREYSRTTQVQILLAEHINGSGRLFGGKLMEWIDITAAVAARRHSGYDVTTAAIDRMQFVSPACVNETMVLDACVTYTGRTSMEIRVESFVEELSGVRRHVNTAHVIMVAVDKNGRPAEVPQLVLTTEQEKLEFAEAKQRAQELRARRG